jgi:predicted dehydrogenase
MGSERIPMVVTGPGPESAEEEDDLFGHHHLEVVGILRTATSPEGRFWRRDVPLFSCLAEARRVPGLQALWMTEPDVALAVEALAAGVGVMMPAPCQASPDELEVLSTSGPGKLLIAHRRHSPMLVQARRLILSGEYGLPWVMQLHVITPGASSSTKRERTFVEAIDALCFVSGLEVSSVYARTGPQNILVGSLDLTRGGCATVSVATSPVTDLRGGGLRRLVLAGSQGLLVLEEDRPLLSVRASEAPTVSRVGGGAAGRWVSRGLLDELAAASACDPEGAATGRRILRSLATLHAALHSAMTASAEDAVISLMPVP